MTPPDATHAAPAESTGPGAGFWESGWIGAPTRAAAVVRGLAVLTFTLVGLAAVWVQWAHASYAAAAAILDVVPAVLLASAAMVALLYWLHGSFGQLFLFMFAALLSAFVGGAALSNAVFAARGVVSPATVGDCSQHTDLRATWMGCQVTLADGTVLARPIRADRQLAGEKVTVTYDPAGLAAPSFGDRTKPNRAVLVIEGIGLLLTAGPVIAATWTGERQRLRGVPSLAESYNPQYYPRRLKARTAGNTP